VGRKVSRICHFGFPVKETVIIKDVVNLIASRKQLKHKSRLYDLPRTNIEVNINDYNPIFFLLHGKEIWTYNIFEKNQGCLLNMLLNI